MIFLIAILFLGFSISVSFLCVVFPIWTIIDCVGSQREKSSKTAWITCMIFFGFLTSLCYVIWGSQNKALRFFSLGTVVLIILLLIGIIGGMGSVVNTASTQIERVLVKVEEYTKQLTVEQTDDFKSTLTFVSKYLKNSAWYDFGRQLDYVDVADQLSYVSQDSSISENDYLDITEMVVAIKIEGSKLLKELSEKRVNKTSRK